MQLAACTSFSIATSTEGTPTARRGGCRGPGLGIALAREPWLLFRRDKFFYGRCSFEGRHHLHRPHPEEPAAGGRLEGWGDLRFASCCNDARSPRMKASFFARLHFFSLRSFSIASVIRSNHWEKISSTGLREDV